MRRPPANTFEIGLVMAGAASAGAYTAGVIDFLVEALQAWEDAKMSGDPNIPDHRVQIRVATGASAGGIVASLLAMLPFTGHFPIRDLAAVRTAAEPANAARNLLYGCWVLETDLARMLAIDDLDGGVPSLLNGRVLAEIAGRAVEAVRAGVSARRPAPAYFANPLQLYLCITNVGGIPYVIRMVADETLRGHCVKCHADYAHFAIYGSGAGAVEAPPAGAISVNLPRDGDPIGDGWDVVQAAALATSAFPGSFPARSFSNRIAAYRERAWLGAAGVDNARLSVSLDLPRLPEETYEFWCIDGGLIDNEPLEYARVALAGAPQSRNPRDVRSADRAVLLIDPFPTNAAPLLTQGTQPDFLGSLFALLPILREHVAFKPQDLMLALQEDVRSRFLIAPIRGTRREGETHLASYGLAGFAGFVSEQLRMHDFQLGRRNCQKFLRDHFYVHAGNPVVAEWAGRLRANPNVLSRCQPSGAEADGMRRTVGEVVQVIPLMDGVREQLPARPWPVLPSDAVIAPLARLIHRRADAIVPELFRGILRRLGVTDRGLVKRVLGTIARDMITKRLGRCAVRAIERDLSDRGLLLRH